MALLDALAWAVAATRWIGVSIVRIDADVAFGRLQGLAADGQLERRRARRARWPQATTDPANVP